MASSLVLKHIHDLDVTSNEIQTWQSVQRIIDRLYENDLALAHFYEEVFGQFYIYEYDEKTEYKYNQVIWFLDSDKELHVIRCNLDVIPPNSLSKWTPQTGFDTLGWKDLNPKLDVLVEFGIKKVLEQYLTRMFKYHTDDTELHPYGKISLDETSKNAVHTKLMKRDMSNADPMREQTFFPYETIYLKPNDQILNGYGRYYDNGLLEFDIVFRLSYAGYREVDSEYAISADVLSCNNISIKDSRTDSKYFYSNSDADIFNRPERLSAYTADLGDTVEYGRTDYCNVYTANITFAQDDKMGHRFIDTNYMIFSSDVTCQDKDTKYQALNVGANQIVYAKKTNTGFTAIYVTYPSQTNLSMPGYNAQHGGLMSNSFHCHIVGKWK